MRTILRAFVIALLVTLAVGLVTGLLVSLITGFIGQQLQPQLPQPQPSQRHAGIHVGGEVYVYVNNELVSRQEMNSFHPNFMKILYAIVTCNPYPVVTDVNGTSRTLNMTIQWKDTGDPEKFYLPLVRYDVYAGVIDVTYHGYPGAKLYAKGGPIDVVVEGAEITAPEKVVLDTSEAKFWVNASFTVPADYTGDLELTYARYLHDKDGNKIYVPMLVDTISVDVARDDQVIIAYKVVIKHPTATSGASTGFIYFVYEMLNPNKDYYKVDGAIYNLATDGKYTLLLHYWSGQSSQSLYVVEPEYKPRASWTGQTWNYHRRDKPYVPNRDPQTEGSYHASLSSDAKTLTIKALFMDASGKNVTGSAFKVWGEMWYAMFSCREDKTVPSDKALLIRIAVKI